MHGSEATFIRDIATGLGFYYLLLCAMNWITAMLLWRKGPVTYFHIAGVIPFTNVLLWLLVGTFFFILAPFTMIGWPPLLPPAAKHAVNMLSGPVTLTVGSLIALTVLFVGRRFFTKPLVAWSGFNLALLAMGLSMTDPTFAAIVQKPDNVPIVGLVFLLAFFTWLASYKAVENDDRMRQGLPPMEKVDDEKVLVWPDLVYTELICMVALTAVLLVWGIALQAPLEDPASSVKTPNPSKAPWYFLGLQEMLVYYDPWYAGVVLPSVVLVGLMAIPFLDFNRQGNGYYTIEQRKFSYIVFQIGFLELWIVLIVLGTFLRGPNWNFFGPFEPWDVHKVLPLNNVDLSQYFWVEWLGRSMPRAPEGSTALQQLPYILLRESPGIIAVIVYLVFLPPLMAATVFRKFFVRMGFIRFMVMSNLLLLMASLPIKMVLRWVFNLKYIISIPEYFLNF
ncbi:MAG TPA: hypothetical protein VHC22_30370 [Pirellulales bacterium]|nr:hypothetical protein [Pirellulales bacterium]